MFPLLECDNCNAKGEDLYHVVVATTGERHVSCRTCQALGGRPAGVRAVAVSEWEYDPERDGYVYARGETGPLPGPTVFRPGDSFPLLVRVGSSQATQPVRVLVGAPGERGVISAAVGLDDYPLILVSPQEAELLQWHARGGGTAEDDAP